VRVRDLPPRGLVTVDPGTSLAEVARRMRTQDSDSAAVLASGRLVGIITERDIVGAIADGIDPGAATADVLMSAEPATVEEEEDVRLVAVRMMALGIRHLPVVDHGGVAVGLISARDLIAVFDSDSDTGRG
jgi:CBS domain-containing protein